MLVQDGKLLHTEMPTQPFDQAALDRWGLTGKWTWHVGYKDREVTFAIDAGALVMHSTYGSFRGGERDGVLVLADRTEGPGPSETTWVNLKRGEDGALVGAVQSVGGEEDEPSAVTVRRL